MATGAIALAGPWDAGQRTAERDAAADAERYGSDAERVGVTVPAADPVLAPLDAAARESSPAALERELVPLLENPALGDHVTAAVVDVTTGASLYAKGARSGRAPASTVKLITAVTALHALGPDHRLTTTAVLDAEEDRVILVGGGDVTLTDDDLRALAERTAEALADRGAGTVRVGYDVSRYAREEDHPIGVNTNIAPITPLQINEGRLDDSTKGPAPRSTDPAADAAEAFARHLADAGVDVKGGAAARRTAPEGAERLARHRSAPLSSLVERMLTNSDNDLAEAIARATAVATGNDADFDGVRRAVTGQLEELGLPLGGVRVADASGLDRHGRITARLLTQALATAADPARPELRAIFTGLPIAGFSGTLAGRFDESDGAGAGLVRAKTGTLTGVNTLAGTAMTPDGRVLAFAFMANETTNAGEAEAALDAAATALATCVCH